jgi:hypothetical protein
VEKPGMTIALLTVITKGLSMKFLLIAFFLLNSLPSFADAIPAKIKLEKVLEIIKSGGAFSKRVTSTGGFAAVNDGNFKQVLVDDVLEQDNPDQCLPPSTSFVNYNGDKIDSDVVTLNVTLDGNKYQLRCQIFTTEEDRTFFATEKDGNTHTIAITCYAKESFDSKPRQVIFKTREIRLRRK